MRVGTAAYILPSLAIRGGHGVAGLHQATQKHLHQSLPAAPFLHSSTTDVMITTITITT